MKYLSRGGYTLLEMFFVLVIVGAAATLGFNALAKMKEKMVLKTEASTVFRTMLHARSLALISRTPHSFFPEERARSYQVLRNGVEYGMRHKLPDNINIEGEPVIFLPKGNCNGGRIIITDKSGKGYAIDVDPVTGTAEISGFQPS